MREFTQPFGPWMYLVTMFHNPAFGGQSVTVGCNDCLRIEHRCHQLAHGHRFYVAWGQNDGAWDNFDFEALAAFEIGADDWLVIWGGGPSPLAREQTLAVIRSVSF